MTYNVLVEMESRIVVVEADTDADAIEIAIDSILTDCQFQGQIIPLAD